MTRKAGETWINESGDLCVVLHQSHDDPKNPALYTLTARLDGESILLVSANGQSLMMTRDESLFLYKAIAQKWPLDALGTIE